MPQMREQGVHSASWLRGPRGVFKDRDSELLDWFLAREVRLTAYDADSNRLLYLDLHDGSYWLLSFLDWPGGSGGSVTLRRVSEAYVAENFPDRPAFQVEESLPPESFS